MSTPTTPLDRPIRVGVIAELTGDLAFMGVANANVARMVIDDLNAAGGLLGQPVELIVEDGATSDEVAAAAARKLVADDRVDVVFGGIYSSTRQAIKGPVVVEGRTLYIYPEQYEGQECDPLIFCTGPVPAQQLEPLVPWLMERTGARRWALPAADYIWPRVMNERVARLVRAGGGEVVAERFHPLDQLDFAEVVAEIMDSGAEVVFNTIVPPGLTPFMQQLWDAGFMERGGQLVCTYFDENCLGLVPPEQVEGLYGCLDYYQDAPDPFSRELLAQYDERFPGSAMFTGGSACSGLYRGLRLWESAVREAGTIDQAAVIDALDHAAIPVGPGGSAEMVPGQHHVRMNMAIAQVRDGALRIVEHLGAVDPDEELVPAPGLARA